MARGEHPGGEVTVSAKLRYAQYEETLRVVLAALERPYRFLNPGSGVDVHVTSEWDSLAHLDPNATALILVAEGNELPDPVTFQRFARVDLIRPPLDPRELGFRLRLAFGAHEAARAAPRQELARGAIRLDLVKRIACVKGEPLELRRAEFDVLAYLLQHSERCVSPLEIEREVLGARGTGAAARNQIFEIRRKLRPTGMAHAIRVVRGRGYSLTFAVALRDESGSLNVAVAAERD